MMHGLTAVRRYQQEQTWGVWRSVTTLLVIAVSVHQLVMAVPSMHMAVMPMPDEGAAQQHNGPHCPLPCPLPLGAVCPAIRTTLPQASGFFLLLFAGALIAAALTLPMPTTPPQRTPLSTWLWPPRRRRAFLQIFLC
ncbi:MAG: hypothetical protein ACR2JW_07165 [Thermomicrobiales bacterium]